MLLAFQFGLNYGFKKTLWTLAGLSVGLFLLLAVSLLGLGFISEKAPFLLTIIKVLGALYLTYLGVKSWIHANQDFTTNDVKVVPTPSELFKTGIWVSLSNPKAILFFAAFFPKFIKFKAPLMSQYVILTVGFFAIETLWQIIYTVSGKQLANWLKTGHRLMWLNRLCGVVFVLIALMLLSDVILQK